MSDVGAEPAGNGPEPNPITPDVVPCSFEVNAGDIRGIPVVELVSYSTTGRHVLYLPPALASELATLLQQQAKAARDLPATPGLIVPRINPDSIRKAIENGGKSN